MASVDTINSENTPLIPINTTTTTYHSCLDPRRRTLLVIVVFLLIFLTFGTNYCDVSLLVLENVMEDDLNITASIFDSFYSYWYLWPNVLFPILGGIMIDKWLGVGRSTIIFCGLSFLGQVLFSVGGYCKWIWLMYAGRLIFSIGAESLVCAKYVYTVLWFFDKKLHFVFGLQLLSVIPGTIFELSSIILDDDLLANDGLSDSHSIGLILLIAAFICLISLIFALILWKLDIRRRKVLEEDAPTDRPDEFHFRDIRQISAALYCVFIIWIFYYIAIIPFTDVAQFLYISKYNLLQSEADACAVLFYLILLIFSPIFGLLIDKIGRNLYWLMFSITIATIAHALLAFLFVHPVLSNILLGISYSIFVTSVPAMVAFLVPKQILGIAYGALVSTHNLGYGVMRIFMDRILDTYGYFMLEIFFIICLEIALLVAAFVYVHNSSKKGTLNDSPSVRLAKQVECESAANTAINALTDTPINPNEYDITDPLT